MTRRLRVAVPRDLLGLTPEGGHGKVWSRVLEQLRESADVRPVRGGRGPLARSPDVVLASGHAVLPSTRAPLVVEVHEAAWFDPELRALLHPDFVADIEPRTDAAVRAAAHVITLSEASRRDLVASYALDPARVHAVHLGVDPVFGPDVPGGRESVARARGGHDSPYVLYAAMIHPRKNLAALRAAMTALAEEGLPHALVVVGGPATDRPDSAELERAAAAELPGFPGRLVRLPRPDDRELAALMAGADAFCLPSLYEGFGLTAAEAMACGTPVIVSDRGALPEIAGEAGLVVSPQAPAIRDALRRVLTTPELGRELGRTGAQRARRFTWQRTAAGWLEVLRTAAGTPRR